MDSLKSRNNYILTLLVPNWLFGMGLIQYPLGTPRTAISLIYSLFCIVTHSTLSAVAYPYIMKASKITAYDDKALYTCLDNSHQVAHLMIDIGIPREYKKIFRCQMSKMILYIVFSLTVITLHYLIVLSHEKPTAREILAASVMCYPVIVALVADSTFLLFIFVISYKFGQLNDQLRKMITSSVTSPQHKRIFTASLRANKCVRNSCVTTIRAIKEAHMLLTKGSQEFNRIFGLQNLLSIAVAFGIITGYVYNAYMLIHESQSQKLIIYKAIASSSVWIVYYTTKMYCLTWACNDCSENSLETGDLINELYDEPAINKDAKSEIRNFNMQMIQKPLKFSAAGFIDLDYTLIQTMIGSITTYLMILIQLGKS